MIYRMIYLGFIMFPPSLNTFNTQKTQKTQGSPQGRKQNARADLVLVVLVVVVAVVDVVVVVVVVVVVGGGGGGRRVSARAFCSRPCTKPCVLRVFCVLAHLTRVGVC